MNETVGNIYKKLYLIFFGLLAFSIPLYNRIAAMAIVLIVFTWIIEGNFKQKFERIKKYRFRRYLLSFSILYLIYLIGFFYSQNQYYALSDLQTNLSMLIFPLLFATIDGDVLKNEKVKILSFHILGCLVVTLLLLTRSFLNFLDSYSVNEFFYVNLTWYHHASYIAMFLVFAIGLLFYRFYTPDQKSNKKYQMLIILLIIYFSFFVLLLSSKAGIIGLLFVFLGHVGYLIFRKKYIGSIVMLLIYTFTLWGSITYLTVAGSRLSTARQAISSDDYDKNSNESTTERLLVYQSALSIIKENVLFGVGTGDANDELLKTYKANQYTVVLENRLNAHNQYLQTFIALGLIGFIVLIGMLFFPLYLAIKQRNILYALLLLLICFNLLAESMFERQAGVVFYAFFNGLFFFYMFTEKQFK